MNWQYAENLDILEVGNKQRLNFISYITSFRNIFNNDSMIRYIDILVIFFIDSVVLNCIDHKQDDSMNYETKNRYYWQFLCWEIILDWWYSYLKS